MHNVTRVFRLPILDCSFYSIFFNVYLSLCSILKTRRIADYKGGVPTSFDHTGQQWDYPNGWSPLEQIMIWALDDIPQTEQIAFDLASSWINSNFLGWQRTRGMFEKVSGIYKI